MAYYALIINEMVFQGPSTTKVNWTQASQMNINDNDKTDNKQSDQWGNQTHNHSNQRG